MQLHELKNPHSRKYAKRIGRGGKKGTYSGRGIKGQRSRTGARIRPAIRDIIKRIPKKRGYRFAGHQPAIALVNLRDLERLAVDGDTVNIAYLRAKGLVGRATAVKILASGAFTKKIRFERCHFSVAATAAIKKAGSEIL